MVDPIRPDRPLRGIALMITGMAILASTDAVGKWATQTYPVSQVLFVRFAVFLLFALALASRRGIAATLATGNRRLQIGRSLLLAFEMWLFVFAISQLPLADVHAVASVSPLIATVLAIPLLGERIGRARWIAVGVGLMGALIAIRPGRTILDPTAALPLIAAFVWALYQTLLRRLRDDPGETTLLYTALIGFGVWAVIAPFSWVPPDAEGWALLGLVSILGVGTHGLLIYAMREAPSATLQPFNYTLLVWALLWGWAGFGHLPDHWTIIGACLIVASGLFALRTARPLP